VNEQALRFILLATIAAIALFLFCLGTQDRWAQGFLALVIFVALYVIATTKWPPWFKEMLDKLFKKLL